MYDVGAATAGSLPAAGACQVAVGRSRAGSGSGLNMWGEGARVRGGTAKPHVWLRRRRHVPLTTWHVHAFESMVYVLLAEGLLQGHCCSRDD